MGLKIFSHNIHGFTSPHIILLQETHFSSDNHLHYFDKTYNQFYYITFSHKSRGVVIFIRNSTIFEIQNIYKDVESRYLILKGTMNKRSLTNRLYISH